MTKIFKDVRLLMSLPTNDCCFPCLFFLYAKQVHLCVTCRTCLDVRFNVYMTRTGLQIELAAISLKHEYSISLNPEIYWKHAINCAGQLANILRSWIIHDTITIKLNYIILLNLQVKIIFKSKFPNIVSKVEMWIFLRSVLFLKRVLSSVISR